LIGQISLVSKELVVAREHQALPTTIYDVSVPTAQLTANNTCQKCDWHQPTLDSATVLIRPGYPDAEYLAEPSDEVYNEP
jgi:hypothetical protein